MERRQPKPQKNEDQEESLEGPTMNLVIINLIFYILTILIGGSFITTGGTAIILFGFSLTTFFGGFIWTPITSLFTHASIPHLMGNMIFLFLYGFKLEERGYSEKGIYLGYILTGVIASFLSAPILRGISVGASGAVFGLLGINAGVERRNKDPNYRSVLFASIILFVISFGENTNVFAHLFGLVFGIILGNSEYFAQFEEE